MAYRGYFRFGQMELARTARVIDHIRELSAADNAALDAQLPGPCRPFDVTYDDSWSGEREFTGQHVPFSLAFAPWVTAHPTNPAAREFLGIWVMDVEGLDSSTVSSSVTESLGDGGSAGYARAASRTANFTALVVATTNAGRQFGLRWLNTVLTRQPAEDVVGGLEFYDASPEASGAAPVVLRAYLPTVSQMPTIADVSGLGGGKQHRQSTIARVEFSITFRDPHLYELLNPVDAEFTSDVGPVQWISDGECTDDASCREHFLYPASCSHDIPVPVNASPVMPTCAGCLTLCDLDTRTARIALPSGASFEEYAVGMTLVNQGASEQSATFHMSYVTGAGDTFCDRFGRAALNGFAPGDGVLVSPAYRGVLGASGGVVARSVGHLTAVTGAPYRFPVIDVSSTPVSEFYLVLECEPTDEWYVSVQLFRRVV